MAALCLTRRRNACGENLASSSQTQALLIFYTLLSRVHADRVWPRYTQLAPIADVGSLSLVQGKRWRGHIPGTGFASSVVLRSRSWQGLLAMDSAERFDFGDGVTAVLTLPDEDVLQTAVLNSSG